MKYYLLSLSIFSRDTTKGSVHFLRRRELTSPQQNTEILSYRYRSMTNPQDRYPTTMFFAVYPDTSFGRNNSFRPFAHLRKNPAGEGGGRKIPQALTDVKANRYKTSASLVVHRVVPRLCSALANELHIYDVQLQHILQQLRSKLGTE